MILCALCIYGIHIARLSLCAKRLLSVWLSEKRDNGVVSGVRNEIQPICVADCQRVCRGECVGGERENPKGRQVASVYIKICM